MIHALDHSSWITTKGRDHAEPSSIHHVLLPRWATLLHLSWTLVGTSLQLHQTAFTWDMALSTSPHFRAPQSVCIKEKLHIRECLPSASNHHVPVSDQLFFLLSCILHDSAQRNEPWWGLFFPFALVEGRKRSGPGGGRADEARKAHQFLALVVGCGCAAVPRGWLAAPLKPPALSACLPAALHAVAAHTGTVGRRQNESDAKAQVWWDGELPAAGTAHVPSTQHQRADFWSRGCELWSLGSSSPLPQHLVVSEQQVKIYF